MDCLYCHNQLRAQDVVFCPICGGAVPDPPARPVPDESVYEWYVSWQGPRGAELVRGLARSLEARGVRAYVPDRTASALDGQDLESVMGRCRSLVLLVSDDAARSAEVGHEVSWWVRNRSKESILAALDSMLPGDERPQLGKPVRLGPEGAASLVEILATSASPGRSPITHTLELPPPAMRQPPAAPQPGEFTQMLQAAKTASPQEPAKTPGEFTRMFQAKPAAPSPSPASITNREEPSKAPGEFTQLFEVPKPPAQPAPAPAAQAPPAKPDQRANPPGEFTRMFQAAKPAAPPQSPAPVTNREEPDKAPGEFTRLFEVPKPPAQPAPAPAAPAPAAKPDQPPPGEFTRMFQAAKPAASSPTPSSTPQARSAPEPAPPRLDDLRFTLTAPSCLPPGSFAELTVWCHLEADTDAIVSRAAQSPDPEPGGAEGVKLSVTVAIEGLEIDPARGEARWTGQIASIPFMIAVPAEAAEGSLSGTVTVRADGLAFATLRFAVVVRNAAGKLARIESELTTPSLPMKLE